MSDAEGPNTAEPTAEGIEGLLEKSSAANSPSIAVGDNPPGGEGADSGAAPAVEVDDAEEGHIANTGSQRDIPGVRTRPA